MRHFIAFAFVALLVGAVVPATATETVEAPYYGGGFRVLGVGPSFLWGGDFTGDGEDDTPRIGGARIEPSSRYTGVSVSASDDVYGSNTGFIVYMWDPEDDGLVQEPYTSGAECGGRTLVSPYMTDEVSVHTFSLLVTDDLAVCGATAGALVADFF